MDFIQLFTTTDPLVIGLIISGLGVLLATARLIAKRTKNKVDDAVVDKAQSLFDKFKKNFKGK